MLSFIWIRSLIHQLIILQQWQIKWIKMTYLYVYNQSCFFRQTKHKLLLRKPHQKVKQRNWVDNFSREFPLGRAMTVAPLLEKYNGKSLLITFSLGKSERLQCSSQERFLNNERQEIHVHLLAARKPKKQNPSMRRCQRFSESLLTSYFGNISIAISFIKRKQAWQKKKWRKFVSAWQQFLSS